MQKDTRFDLLHDERIYLCWATDKPQFKQTSFCHVHGRTQASPASNLSKKHQVSFKFDIILMISLNPRLIASNRHYCKWGLISNKIGAKRKDIRCWQFADAKQNQIALTLLKWSIFGSKNLIKCAIGTMDSTSTKFATRSH